MPKFRAQKPSAPIEPEAKSAPKAEPKHEIPPVPQFLLASAEVASSVSALPETAPLPVAPQEKKSSWDRATIMASAGIVLFAVFFAMNRPSRLRDSGAIQDSTDAAPATASAEKPVHSASAAALDPAAKAPTVALAAPAAIADHVTISHAAPQPAVAQNKVNRSPGILPESTSRQGRALVKVLPAAAVLRAGPGTRYPKMGVARAELRLIVKSATDTWTEVEGESGTAWIRNDLIRAVGVVGDSRGDNR